MQHSTVAKPNFNIIKMKNWLLSYRWHIIAWTIFILYEYLFVVLILQVCSPILTNIIHYAINICLFYIHSNLLLARNLEHKKPAHLKLIVLIIFELISYTFIAYLADEIRIRIPLNAIPKSIMINWRFISSTLWRGIYFMLFATTYYFLKRYMAQKQRTAKLEREAIEKKLKQKETDIELANAKNAYLKAQINPHFLLNTLTYISNNTHKTDPREAEAVWYLSKLMRYAMECEHGPEIMPLEKRSGRLKTLCN
ncbi:hypothetical protein ASE74_24195 [Pedobacter sp. Leaf216]|nr:hypothetical protein ASE74_24195 [Pedobacter sp. Leaf216]